MVEEVSYIFQRAYEIFIGPIPEQYRIFANLVIYTVLIALYALFIWKFHKFLSNKDIIKLNLEKYNTSEHPFWSKIVASILYLLEYIIILPVIVFLWFGIFSVFLFLLSKSQDAGSILLITASIVAAIRVSSYFSQELSSDLAKIFPLTFLTFFVIEPEFLSLSKLALRIESIPSVLGSLLFYLIFIIIIEILMRLAYTIADLFTSKEGEINVRFTSK